MNKKIIIVIIDSGVNDKHPKFTNDTITGIALTNNQIRSSFKDDFGHGTAIYNIIRECTDFAEIINLKINGIENGVEENDIIYALQYVYENINANIINLSLGITISEHISEFENICDLLSTKGAYIVSAYDNDGAMSYPALFESVIGVSSSDNCINKDDYEYVENSCVNILAKGGLQRVAWVYPSYIFMSGNSFACAHVTVIIAKLLKDNVNASRNYIMNEIKNGAKKVYTKSLFLEMRKPVFKIENAALFPFNKEMHALVRFSNILSFHITDIYDVKYSLKVGSKTNILLKNNDILNRTIKNIENIDWKSFDTLILGHTKSMSKLINDDSLTKKIIDKALEKGKNIYSLADISDYANINGNLNVYYPKINSENVNSNLGKLFIPHKPVLGIFGTSSAQGKFTLQLKIRKRFLDMGYKVGQIGTEPTSLLFGMDYVFPMGYESTVNLTNHEIVQYLNMCINNLSNNENDLIIVGSQSGTLTYDLRNLKYYNIEQYLFLLGTQPDGIILCINPYDDMDYIKKTILYLESCIDTKVIALVVFPMTLPNDWRAISNSKQHLTVEQFEKLRLNLKNNIDIPVYNLDDDDLIKCLCDMIIEYY